MPNISSDTSVDVETDPRKDAEPTRPELDFDEGEISPCWYSPYPDADLTQAEQLELKRICQDFGNVDVAARRWEVEMAWQTRLFDRGYQYLWPRRGGGWIYIPFATDYQHGRGGQALYGNETNIIAAYGEIISAALTRDIPRVRFEPQNPSSDADITAKCAATNYARIFSRSNDLQNLQQQLAYYLRTDGRALIVTDHIKDAQQFGRMDANAPDPAVPETEATGPQPLMYAVRHGETEMNQEGRMRGRAEIPINEKGDRQMDRASDWLKDKGIKAIISSPVERALSSAQILAEKLGVPLEVDDRLASLDIGSLAGQASDMSNEDLEEAFETKRDVPIAGGETPEEFENRIQSAVMDWLSNPENPVALVVHDSVISQIFKMFQGDDVPPSSTVDPGWIASITQNPDQTYKPQVVFPVFPPEISMGEQRGAPRGQEIAKVYGVLEHKVPFSAPSADLDDCTIVQVSGEYDLDYVKAMFPDKADRIKAGGAAAGENELDRIARINCNLALNASYVTGDSMVRDCTIHRVWMRPAKFMSVENKELRANLFAKLPDGAMVILAGGDGEFIKARNECMDDHLTLIHALPGTGMNRLALCSKLLSINKRLNNWLDLIDQYFVKCVPMRYMASGPFDVNAINDQGTVVGGYVPFLLDNIPQNRAVTDLIWQEPYPTAQPLMGDFIKWFAGELPQMLSHALPSLFGSAANTDSGVAIGIQRDQALGCLGSPWHSINVATARYFRQAVQLAARCRTDAIEGLDSGGTKIRIELTELKGNILAYPESDANFPESWVQKQSRWTQLLTDANNAFVQKLLANIANRRAALNAIALEGLKDPEADSWDKQMGEFEILLKTPPVPNPDYTKAQAAIAETAQMIQAKQSTGIPATPQEIQSIQQMEQQLETITPLVSSVRVKDTDNHAVEAECCLDKINGPEGRKMADGTLQERLAFQNLSLHYAEHKAKIPSPPAEIKDLPKGFSAPIDKLPPDAAATVLTSVGAETKGPDVVQNREFNAEIRKSSKVGGPPVPGIGQ